MRRLIPVSLGLKLGVGLVFAALLLGAGFAAQNVLGGGDRDESGAIVVSGAQPQAFASHFFSNTTVVSYNSVSNAERRCNGVFNEPGVGQYLYILLQATNDSEMSCMYIAEAIANGRTVGGYINADYTVNFIEVE
jgi:hypothetical protein